MSTVQIGRIRSAASVPLLSPAVTIRTSLRSPPWLNRSPLPSNRPPVSSSQWRALHLYKTAKAKTVLGQHKVIPFRLYTPPAPSESEHLVNLVDDQTSEVVAKDITLEQLYNDHVQPGKLLYLTNPVKKPWSYQIEQQVEQGIPRIYNNYALAQALTVPGVHVRLDKPKWVNQKNPVFKQLAALREVHVQLNSPATYYRMMMDKAYRFLEGACPVEVVIRFAGKMVSAKERMDPGPADRWPWMHNHYPHLRPDFILKCMPKGTYYLIEPVTDGRNVQWVMAMPSEQQNASSVNLTQRLFKVQKAVKKNIVAGQQPELPMALRLGLIESGSEDYSLDSGAPKNSSYAARAVEKLQVDIMTGQAHKHKKRNELRWGAESLDAITETKRANVRYDPEAFKENHLSKWEKPASASPSDTRVPNRLKIPGPDTLGRDRYLPAPELRYMPGRDQTLHPLAQRLKRILAHSEITKQKVSKSEYTPRPAPEFQGTDRIEGIGERDPKRTPKRLGRYAKEAKKEADAAEKKAFAKEVLLRAYKKG